MFDKLQKFLARITNRKFYSRPTRKTAFLSAPIKNPPPPLEKTCPVCGKSFIPNSHSQKYCSDDCCKKIRRVRERKGWPERVCVGCGKTFRMTNGRQKYCPACMQKKYGRTPTHEGSCEFCGKTFITSQPERKYCSADCRAAAHLDKVRKTPREAVCVICGKTFVRRKGNQNTCSAQCRAERNRISKIESDRRRAEARKAQQPKEKTCPACGKTFTFTHGCQIFCSKKCNESFYYRTHRKKSLPTPKKCLHCGKSFTPTKKSQKYCSVRCRHQNELLRKKDSKPKKTCEICGKPIYKRNQKYCSDCTPYKKRDPMKKTCPVCGNIFVTTRKKAKYCSQTCSDAAHSAQDRERYVASKPEVEQTCQNCGKEFIATSTRQVFCSRSCKEEYEKLLYSSKPKVSKTAFSSSKKPKSGKTIEQWNREAAQCGMSYGLYRAAINAGKTFDELKLPEPAPVEEKILFECKI